MANSNGQSPRIGGTAAHKRPMTLANEPVQVLNPENGEIVTTTRQNANDLVRHMGWQWATVTGSPPKSALGPKSKVIIADLEYDPNAPEGDEAPELPEGLEDVNSGKSAQEAEKTAEEQALMKAKEEIDALRAEASGLGIDVDMRWGRARLNDEIATKREELAASETTEDEGEE